MQKRLFEVLYAFRFALYAIIIAVSYKGSKEIIQVRRQQRLQFSFGLWAEHHFEI